jgi:O-antigen/teichoic acid export membrane protein
LASRSTLLARGLIAVPLITRAIGPAEFGRLALGIALLATLRCIAVTGIEPIVVRECARRPDEEGAILAAARRLRCALAFGSVPVAIAIGLALGGVRVAVIAGILTPALIVEALATQRLALDVRLRGEWIALAQFTGGFCFVTGVAIAYLTAAHLFVFAGLYLGQLVVTSVLAAAFARRYRVPVRGRYSAWRLLRMGLSTTGAALVRAATEHLAVVVIACVLNMSAAGMWSAAHRFVGAAVLLPAALADSWLPVLARHRAGEIASRARRVIPPFIVVGVALWAGFALSAPWVTGAFGAQFATAGELLPILGMGVGLVCVTHPLSTALIAANKQADAARCELATLVTSQALLWATVPVLGVRGAAWASVAACAVRAILLAGSLFRTVAPERDATSAGRMHPLQAQASSDCPR